MAHEFFMTAELRERAGKGAARTIRRSGRVPAVIYGNKQDPMMISLDPVELMQRIKGHGFFTRVCELEVGGEKHRVLARDLQQDPVSDRPIHVDFMRFGAKTKFNVDVEVIFEKEEASPGIKKGGVINVVRHTVELRCSPDNIPESLIVDLTGLDIGDSVHISSIKLPDGVTPTITDRDFTVATIAAPTIHVEVEEGEEAEEGAAVAGEEKGEGEKASDED